MHNKNFSEKLEYLGRRLELEGKHVWGTTGVIDDDGKIHLYFSAWDKTDPHASWVISCKVYHAVAESLDSEFEIKGLALEGREGQGWDSWSIHNPSITKIDGKYVMAYMGSSGDKLKYSQSELANHILNLEKQGKFHVPEDAVEGCTKNEEDFAGEIWECYLRLVESKRVGLAISDSPNGPWKRLTNRETPTIDVSKRGNWDDVVASNPTIVKKDNKYLIYYKSWDYKSWETKHGNRKYGLAISDTLTGEYKKYEGNPVLDFEDLGKNAQLEDANVFLYEDKLYMVARDMGIEDNYRGIILSSKDGTKWTKPEKAYGPLSEYSDEKPLGLPREGRFERPQVLLKDGKPYALLTALIGGEYKTSSTAIFKINL